MEEDYNTIYGIERLAELLIERGIEFYVKDEMSLLFMDGNGNPHECWMAGAEENLVNVMIVVTPEQAISVPDLNGVISENERLTEQCGRLFDKTLELGTENAELWEYVKWLEELALRDLNHYRELKFEFEMKRRELGIEVD